MYLCDVRQGKHCTYLTNPSSADGWYSGFLSSDGKHPTLLGYEAFAFQVLNDIPELMQY